MKLTNREKILLPSVLIFILAALFIYFVYFPLNKEIDALKIQSDTLETQLLEARARQAQVESLKAQIPALEEQVEKVSEDMIALWDEPELLDFMEEMLSPLCFRQTIDYYDTAQIGAIESKNIGLAFTTHYKNLQKIWDNLEKAEYFNTITSFSVKENSGNEPDTTEGPFLDVTMEVCFYSRNAAKDYPEKYDFMKGKGSYGKKNPFIEPQNN